MIHTLSLEKFENNIKSLVKALKVNCRLLASCGETESSILANLLRLLKKYPSSGFNSYIRRFQVKYESLVEDGHWDTKSELGYFFRTLRRFVRIEDSLSPMDAISLRFPFKALTNDLMLLSNFSKESDNHHQSGPMAWKLLTTKILRGVKQGICRAQNIIYT